MGSFIQHIPNIGGAKNKHIGTASQMQLSGKPTPNRHPKKVQHTPGRLRKRLKLSQPRFYPDINFYVLKCLSDLKALYPGL